MECTVYGAVHLSLQTVSAVKPQLMKMNVFNFAGVSSSQRLAGFLSPQLYFLSYLSLLSLHFQTLQKLVQLPHYQQVSAAA